MVTYSAVSKAIQELKNENIRPSVANIRNRIGGGSNSKILAVMAEYSKTNKVGLPAVNASLLDELIKLVDEISAKRITEATIEQKRDMDDRVTNLADMVELIGKLEDELEQLKGQVEDLQRININQSAEIKSLKDNLTSKNDELIKKQEITQTQRDELLKLKIRETDFEAAKIELAQARAEAKLEIAQARAEANLEIAKARAEATEAKEQAAMLKGLLEGRNQTEVPNSGPETKKPVSKKVSIKRTKAIN
jgi:chromosome segregation ATPase